MRGFRGFDALSFVRFFGLPMPRRCPLLRCSKILSSVSYPNCAQTCDSPSKSSGMVGCAGLDFLSGHTAASPESLIRGPARPSACTPHVRLKAAASARKADIVETSIETESFGEPEPFAEAGAQSEWFGKRDRPVRLDGRLTASCRNVLGQLPIEDNAKSRGVDFQ
jgi:hypothetical protein